MGPNSEGVTDRGNHILRYAYLPHAGGATETQPWLAAYAFNQPLVPVWRAGDQIEVQLPFMPDVPTRSFASVSVVRAFPQSFSLISADSGIVADLYRHGDQIAAVILDVDPTTPVTLTSGTRQTVLAPSSLTVMLADLSLPGEGTR